MMLWAGIFLLPQKMIFRENTMESQEKTLSLYFDAAESKTAEAGVHPHASRAGIIASVAIHTVFLLFFVLQPAAKMAAVKTFTISFAEGGASVLKSPAPPAAGVKKEPAPIAPPTKKQALPTQPHRAAIKPDPVAVAPAVVIQPAIEPPPTIDQTRAEMALPPVSQSARGDDFIASTATLPARDASISPNRGTAAGAIVATVGSGGGNGSGIGTGNGYGSGASIENGNGAPLETSFGAMNAPSFIHRAIPVYPPLARRQGKEGRVVLTLLIDQTGRLQKIDVTEGAGFGLTEAAIEAVRNSTFAPARVNGKKTASRAVLPIRFKLE
jgi:protein TonB